MTTPYSSPVTTPADMARCRAWAEAYLARAGDLPIAFELDGQAVRGIPEAWRPAARTRRIDANMIETVFEGTKPRTGLNVRVECVQYLDFPVVEWVAWLSNRGSAATPLISDIRGLAADFAGEAPVLTHSNGDFASAKGYSAEATRLKAGKALTFEPLGGRACDEAFPYFRLALAGGVGPTVVGVTLAIGWPGQWSARFTGTGEGVRVEAGQALTHLRLLPGESIRTPRMTVMAWEGDEARAINLWRRWYLAHILPRPDGRPMQPHLACAATARGNEFTGATEANQIAFIEKFNRHGIQPDVWWIDAGWYPCYNAEHLRRWPEVGTWRPDPERFPNGLRPIADRAAELGASLLTWFEPERVMAGTELDREHPEWLLKVTSETRKSLRTSGTAQDKLLNLGIPACRQWLTDHVCGMIQANGIRIYRQDHNFRPLAYWRQNDADDRQGMTENLHVQGYLQFWDDLLARNPGLWIDSCASGGRRNDLETMRRSVPLHYTDYGYGYPPVKLAMHRTLYEWIPYFKEFTLAWDLDGKSRFDHTVDSFAFHCGLAPMLFATLDIRRDDYDFALARQMIEVWRRAAPLMLWGDYTAHTPAHRSAAQWVARQFDSPETGTGLVQGIRLPAAADKTLTIFPRGLRAEARYVFEEAESGEVRDLAGEALLESGFTFALPRRAGSVWFYRRVEG